MKGITNGTRKTDVAIDSALSITSPNPVQNKVITTALNTTNANVSSLQTAVNTINSKIDPFASSSNKLTSESTVDNKILASIVDNVSSTATDKSLSANMGKTLQEQISNLKNIGRFLAIWNADAGTVTKEPPVSPYTYKVGDYYRVGVSGTKNPKGSLTYVTGETNYVEGESLNVGDVVYCNSVTETETVWAKQSSSGGGTVQDVQLDGVSILNEGIANILSQNIGNIGGNAVNVTGTVAISHGGTGAVTDVDARTNLGIGHTYLIGSGTYSFLSFAKTDTFPSSSDLIKYSATYIISGGGLATNGTVAKFGGVYLVVVGAQSTSNIKMDVIRLRGTDNDDNPLLSWGYFVEDGVVYYGLKCTNSSTKNEFSATRITSNNGYVKDDNTAYQTLPSGIVNVEYNGVAYANTAGNAINAQTADGYTLNGAIKTALDKKIDTAGSGLSKEGTTLSHSNSVNEQATQAVYPIKIDAQGHISAYGSAVTVPTKTSELTNDSGFVTTDKYLRQSQTTTTNYRPVILGYQNNATPGSTSLYTDVTNEAYTTNFIYAQPSTGAFIAKAYAKSDCHIISPGGGSYVTTDSTKTGYLKITLPQSWTNTMMSFWIDIYNYSTGTSCSYRVGGYNYSSSTAWGNTFALSTGNNSRSNLTVRFGHDGSKCAIYIGESNTSWNYPQIIVRDVQVGYSNYGVERWTTGWTVDFTTTLGTITGTTITPPIFCNFLSGTSATKTDNKTQTTTLRIGFASGVLNIWNS